MTTSKIDLGSLPDLIPYLDFTISLALKGGAIIKEGIARRRSSGGIVQEKYDNPSDLVTETDRAVEEFVKSEIFKTYPDHKFIGEETFTSGVKSEFTDDPTWIVDPIDGTTNFIHGYPFVAISISLAIFRVPVIGVIYNPLLDEMYTAARGHGAYLNHKDKLPLFNSPQPLSSVAECLICTEIGSDRSSKVLVSKINSIHNFVAKKEDKGSQAESIARMGQAHSIRATGSAALNLCMVARGAADVYWEVGCWEWDVAAGIVIVEESGGIVVTGGKSMSLEPVNIFSRKFLAIRATKTPEEQERIAKEMWELMEDVEAIRDPVPGGFEY